MLKYLIRLLCINIIVLCLFKVETTFSSAEGATTPETLRQKDLKRINSGKKIVLTEGVNLSGKKTDGVKELI